MASETREITLRAADAINRRDIEALQQLLAPDVELVPMRAAMERISFKGPKAAALFFAAIDETWEDLRIEPDEIRATPSDAFGKGRIRATGRDSRVEVTMELAWILRFEGSGLITSLRSYVDIAKAVEDAAALGL